MQKPTEKPLKVDTYSHTYSHAACRCWKVVPQAKHYKMSQRGSGPSWRQTGYCGQQYRYPYIADNVASFPGHGRIDWEWVKYTALQKTGKGGEAGWQPGNEATILYTYQRNQHTRCPPHTPSSHIYTLSPLPHTHHSWSTSSLFLWLTS